MVDYYNLEKTAEILKMAPAEVNRIREQGKLRAFRDGSDWKFRKEDVENYLVTVIKGRSSQEDSPFDFFDLGEDEDNDLLTKDDEGITSFLADSASFDALLDQSLASDGLVASHKTPDDELTLIADGNFHIDENFILNNDSGNDDNESDIQDFEGLDHDIVLLDEKDISADDDLVLVEEGENADDDLVLVEEGENADDDLVLVEEGENADDDLVLVEEGENADDLVLLKDENDDIIPLAEANVVAENQPSLETSETSETLETLETKEEDIRLTEDAPEIFGILGSDSDGGSGINLNLSGDSRDIPFAKQGDNGSGIDLAGDDFMDDDIILGGSGSSGSDINLAGDSGLSLLDAAAESDFAISKVLGGSDAILELAADDDILALVDDDVDLDTATILGAAEGDFQLSVDQDFGGDDSESSSQVIAIEDDLADDLGFAPFELEDQSTAPTVPATAPVSTVTPKTPATSAKTSAASATDDIDALLFAESDEDSEVSAPFAALDSTDASESATPMLDSNVFSGFDSGGSGFDASGFGDSGLGGLDSGSSPFGGVSSEDHLPSPGAASHASTGSPTETVFSGAIVSSLAAIFFLLMFGGILIFDLIRNMWSWQEPFTINSFIMDTFKGLLG